MWNIWGWVEHVGVGGGGWSVWGWVEHVGVGGACGGGWSMWGWGGSIVEME